MRGVQARERERGTREKAKDGRTRDEDEEDKGVIQHFEKVDFPASPGLINLLQSHQTNSSPTSHPAT